MAYTARTLITDAYYLSGLFSRGLQEVPGDYETLGLRLLNEALAVDSITINIIPYYEEHVFNFVPGQEKYFIDRLIDVDNAVFKINEVRYPLKEKQRNDYFGKSRADNISSLPYQFHLEEARENDKAGANLYFYFIPAQAWECKIWGKFALTHIDNLDVDLSLEYPERFIAYLKYLLAQFICEDAQIILGEQAQAKLAELTEKLQNKSPIDLSVQKVSTFDKAPGMNYGWANLGTGWVP